MIGYHFNTFNQLIVSCLSPIKKSNFLLVMAMVKKLDVFSATTEYSKTYVFHDEDHTMGNALRYVLMRKYDYF